MQTNVLASMDAASKLRTVLRVNAATSLGGGVVAAAATSWIGEILDVGSELAVRIVGIALIVFAIDVLVTARSPKVTSGAKLISVADFTWVAGTIVLAVLGAFSGPGVAIMLAVAVAVGGFGVAQLRLARPSVVS